MSDGNTAKGPKVTPEQEEILLRFAYHHAQQPQIDEMSRLRDSFGRLAIQVEKACPKGRELSVALTKLEEAMFWTNAAISRHLK